LKIIYQILILRIIFSKISLFGMLVLNAWNYTNI